MPLARSRITRADIARVDDDAAPTCTLDYVRAALGRRDYGPARFCTYLGLLIDGHGFPPPIPALRYDRHSKAQRLDSAVRPASRFHRAAVDAWIGDTLPPTSTTALDREARRAAAAEMDGNAFNLKLIAGGRA